MITNKTVSKIQQSNLSCFFCYGNYLIFVAIAFVIFAYAISITDIISSHSITEVSAIFFKHLLYKTFHLQSHGILFVIVLAYFLFVIIVNALTFMSFASFGTNIFGDKTLQLPVHLSKITMNGYCLSSKEFQSVMHGSSFNDSRLVWSSCNYSRVVIDCKIKQIFF